MATAKAAPKNVQKAATRRRPAAVPASLRTQIAAAQADKFADADLKAAFNRLGTEITRMVKRPREAPKVPFLRGIRIRNLLSFGPDTPMLDLQNFNVLIGLNASGKSNLIEAIQLLKSLPTDLSAPINRSGSIEHWLHKPQKPCAESPPGTATIESIFSPEVPNGDGPDCSRIAPPSQHPIPPPFFYHRLGIGMRNHARVQLERESLDRLNVRSAGQRGLSTHNLFEYLGEDSFAAQQSPSDGRPGKLDRVEQLSSHGPQSFFHQRQGSREFPETALIARQLARVGIYREWSFGQHSGLRQPHSIVDSDEPLRPDLSNFLAVANRITLHPTAKRRILEELRYHMNNVQDFTFLVHAGTTHLYFQEGEKMIPATRLSDGALRHFCLLLILCDPDPPPLICIEEPELGIHMDVIPPLAQLMEEASQRTQLIVTTHSMMMVDSMTECPEAIVVCEQFQGRTEMERLNMKDVLRLVADEDSKNGLSWFWSKGFIRGVH